MAVSVRSCYMDSLSDLNSVVDFAAKVLGGEYIGWNPYAGPPDEWGQPESEYERYPIPRVEFDTVVGTGLSGALVLPLLAQRFECNYLAVRKPNDGSHSSYPAEGSLGDRWIFVDDFTSSGRTLARYYHTVQAICREHNATSEFVGVFQYEQRDEPWRTAEEVSASLRCWRPTKRRGSSGVIDVEWVAP